VSATAVAGTRPRGSVMTALFVALGCTLLASRAWLGPLAPPARAGLYLLVFAAMLSGSLLMPATRAPLLALGGTDRERRARGAALPVAFVLAAGLVTIALAAVVAGTPVPLPVAAWTLPLSLLAAVAEEALFRRVAYGQLLRWGALVAVVGAAFLFAIVHVPLYGVAALPVDLGAGLVFGWQRWASGTWTVPAATHAAANLVAVLR